MDLIIFEDNEVTRKALVSLILEFNKTIFAGKEKINILLASGHEKQIINFAYELKLPTAFVLDIEARNQNVGFEIAKKVKQSNPNHIILYVTKEQEVITRNYIEREKAIGFVIKSIDINFIHSIYYYLARCMVVLWGENFFTFNNQEFIVSNVPYSDIILFEKIKNRDKVYLHHFYGNKLSLASFYCKSIKGLYKTLDSRFIDCHRSYIVNKDMILARTRTDLYLKGNLTCPYVESRLWNRL